MLILFPSQIKYKKYLISLTINFITKHIKIQVENNEVGTFKSKISYFIISLWINQHELSTWRWIIIKLNSNVVEKYKFNISTVNDKQNNTLLLIFYNS